MFQMDVPIPSAEQTLFFRKVTREVADSNLPAVTASLERLSVNTSLMSTTDGKRVLRKRIRRTLCNETLNRRCSLKPKKRTSSQMENEDDIKDYYLDKSIKKVQNNLETIYEEKEGTNENDRFMSVKRYKRMIQFQATSDAKLRKRRAKIKRAFGSQVIFKKTLFKYSSMQSMQKLIDKLSEIRAPSPSQTEKEVK